MALAALAGWHADSMAFRFSTDNMCVAEASDPTAGTGDVPADEDIHAT